MEVRREYGELVEIQQMQPWWGWVGNLWTWMEVRERQNMDGVGTLMKVGQDLFRCELHISKPWCVRDGAAWIWDYIFETWMEMRCYMDWCELQIYAPLLMWGIIWMERTGAYGAYGNLDWGKTLISRPGWRWDGTRIDFDMNIMRYASGEMGLGWSWDVFLVTYMSVKRDPDEGEAQKSVLGCWWDVTWLEVRCKYSDHGGGEIVHGWKWDRNIWTWMEVSQYMDGDETIILGLGCWWGRT